MTEEDTCKNCVFYEPKENKCWENPANPKTVTQPDAKCERTIKNNAEESEKPK